MADEDKSSNNTGASTATVENASRGLGDFIEKLKGDQYKSNSGSAIPANFAKELSLLNVKFSSSESLLRGIAKTETDSKALLKSIEKQSAGIVDIRELLAKQGESIVNTSSSSDIDTAEEALTSKQVQPVALVDIKDEAIKKLEGIFSKLNISTKAVVEPKAAKGPGTGKDLAGLFSGLLGTLFAGAKNLGALILDPLKDLLFNPVTGLVASLGLGIASWFDDGPFKGVKELISKIGIKMFGENALKLLSEKFATWATKLLPEAGGDIAKTMLGGLKGTLGRLSGTMAKFLGEALRFIPLVSSLIDIGDAVSRMLDGDYIGGLLSFGAAIAGVVPGVGQAISIAISIINAGRDLTSGGVKENAKTGANVQLGKIWQWFVDKMASIMGYYFDKIGEGWDYIKKGEYGRGIIAWTSIIPGLGWLSSVCDWLLGTPEKVDFGKVEPADKGFLAKIWDWLQKSTTEKFDDIRNAVTSVFTSLGNSIIDSVTSVSDWFTSIGKDVSSFIDDPIKALTKMWDTIKNKIKNIISAPIDMIKSGWDKITGIFNSDEKTAALEKSGVKKVAPGVENVEEKKINDAIVEQKKRNDWLISNGMRPALYMPNTGTPPSGITANQEPQLTADTPDNAISTNNTPSDTNVKSTPVPRVDLDIPSQPSSVAAIKELNENIVKQIQLAKTGGSGQGGSFAGINSSSQASNNLTTNINGGSVDRDIPYIERNKYRQQQAFYRSLL